MRGGVASGGGAMWGPVEGRLLGVSHHERGQPHEAALLREQGRGSLDGRSVTHASAAAGAAQHNPLPYHPAALPPPALIHLDRRPRPHPGPPRRGRGLAARLLVVRPAGPHCGAPPAQPRSSALAHRRHALSPRSELTLERGRRTHEAVDASWPAPTRCLGVVLVRDSGVADVYRCAITVRPGSRGYGLCATPRAREDPHLAIAHWCHMCVASSHREEIA